MAIFKCKVGSNYGKRNELVDLKGVKHDELTDRQKQLLEPHKEQSVKVVDSGKEPSAADIVKIIKAAETLESIAEYAEDDRKTVKEAYKAKASTYWHPP